MIPNVEASQKFYFGTPKNFLYEVLHSGQNMTKIFFILVLLIAVPLTAQAQAESNIPSYRGYVNDFASVIDSADERAIGTVAQELDSKTTAQIAVVTLPTTKPVSIEQYAVQLFKEWGIGKKGKDNGILILMAVDDKTVRIETGYGLEGAIPDAVASQIINRIMIPQFKQGNYSKGLLLAVVSVAQLIAKEYNITLSSAKEYATQLDASRYNPMEGFMPLFIILGCWIFLMIITKYTNKKYKRKGGMWYAGPGYYGRGGFGGGFGGFGGGLSGGGGATGRW